MPQVNSIRLSAPFRWLRLGFNDFRTAFVPSFAYGVALAGASFLLWQALLDSNLAFWALVLSCGFVFVAPILGMGLYEAGRALETGSRPTLRQVFFVRSAFRGDVFYLGLALVLIYLMWGRIAQIVYGLSTYRLHRTIGEFITFAVQTSEGHAMLISGAIVGGLMAFFTFSLVLVSAPMLLAPGANVFEAIFTSVRAVNKNFFPVLLWAALITLLLLGAAATSWLGLAVIFPWLGLASWRAYRELVAT